MYLKSILHFLCIVSTFLTATLTAQDNHYAWLQYGSRNSILNNANLSHFEDQSAVIINPATLSEATQSSFNFNTSALGFNAINFSNGLGQGYSLKNSNLSIFPSVATGVIRPKNPEKKMTIGYAIYTSNLDNLDFAERTEARYNLLNDTESPGDETYVAQYTVTTNLSEVTSALGVGWKLGDNMSLGISQSFAFRSHQFTTKFSAYVVPDYDAGASVSEAGVIENYVAKYSKFMTYTKVGLTTSLGKWDVGLTLTTPTIGVFGSGRILADLNVTNIRLDTNLSTPRISLVANGQFKKIKAKYKYPINIGLGISRAFGNVRLYGSLAWYGSISPYKVLDPPEDVFLLPPTDDNILLTDDLLAAWSGNRSVINGSIAADWKLKSGFNLLCSFRSDGHYYQPQEEKSGFTTAIKVWDNYHFTIGTHKAFKTSEWVVGLKFNTGKRKDFPQPANFADPTEETLFQGSRTTGVITSRGVQLLISYTFTLSKPSADNTATQD